MILSDIFMNIETKVYTAIPQGFSPKLEVAAVYVEVADRLLLLQIADHKQERGCWGVPAGKLETNETALQAAKRELFEETRIEGELEDFQELGALYIRKPGLDYVYHLFALHLNVPPSLSLSAEHSSYTWASKEEALALPLMNGAHEALDTFFMRVKVAKECLKK